MLFNSLQFFLFFPVVTLLYFLTPQRFRWLVLLLASCYFYIAFVPIYILVLFFAITIDYLAGILISQSTGKKRRLFLIISIISNLTILGIFKYFNFFADNISQIAQFLHWNLPIQFLTLVLPIGLSFHIFQSLSYVIEVYRKAVKPERHFGIYALYVMFYPQLVAGPIERSYHMLPQFHSKHFFNEEHVSRGLQQMLFGFFKKIVIADRLAILVDQIYNMPTAYHGITLIIATIAFAIQIYTDFSGYTDIALGSARVMGFELTNNFNYPYLSKSIGEFWRRWHISLSSWLRDYLYIPLGGSKGNRVKHYRNILLTFLASGLWHGAAWTFVFWGLLHGLYIVFTDILARASHKLFSFKIGPRLQNMFGAMQIIVTFVLICLAWVFFRAKTFSDAFYILTHFQEGLHGILTGLLRLDFRSLDILIYQQGQGLGLSYTEIIIAVFAIIFLILFEYLQRHALFFRCPFVIRWLFYIVMTLAIVNLGIIQRKPFIYFQF